MAPSEVAVVSAAYMLSCSALLITNKLCVQLVPAPSFVAGVQFAFTSAIVAVLSCANAATVDALEWSKVKPYLLYVFVFFGAIYFNMAALRLASVGTLLVVRACCPLLVCVIEWLVLGRHLPSGKSVLALATVSVSAFVYVQSDSELKLQGTQAVTMIACYFVTICASDTFGKWIVKELQWQSMWGPVLYTNFLSLPPVLVASVVTHEELKLAAVNWSGRTVALLVLGCILSVAISYSAWRCRCLVAATTFTLLGIANKLTSVLVAALIWDPPSAVGMASLVLCLSAATQYTAPPMRAKGSAQPLSDLFAEMTARRAVPVVVLALLCTGAVAGGWSTSAAPAGADLKMGASKVPVLGHDLHGKSLRLQTTTTPHVHHRRRANESNPTSSYRLRINVSKALLDQHRSKALAKRMATTSTKTKVKRTKHVLKDLEDP
tara:strand:- start:1241 stop:2545 length:1305 start_codon:yes stop_codon:yes gene_type:complete